MDRRMFPNSPSRARTYDLAVNSRPLYLLSYRGNIKHIIMHISANMSRGSQEFFIPAVIFMSVLDKGLCVP
jgi:hypothetical protein